ncbi:MAG: hypothetical protein ACE5JD_15190 [Candidatus Methylomirabilia bacterium]
MLASRPALMGNPLLLLMDKPTPGLVPLLIRNLTDQVLKLKRRALGVRWPTGFT